MPAHLWARCWHARWWGQGCVWLLVPLLLCSYPVPEVGAGRNPVELLIGIWEVLEIGAEELLLQAQGCWHFLAVTAQQEPPVHVDELQGKNNHTCFPESPHCGLVELQNVFGRSRFPVQLKGRQEGHNLPCILMKPLGS